MSRRRKRKENKITRIQRLMITQNHRKDQESAACEQWVATHGYTMHDVEAEPLVFCFYNEPTHDGYAQCIREIQQIKLAKQSGE